MKNIFTLSIFIFLSHTIIAQAWSWAIPDGHITGYENVGAMATDAPGNSYIGGVFNGPVVIFGNDTMANGSAPGSMEGYITKYDINGGVQWVEGLHGPSDALISSMCIDNSGNLIVAGNMSQGFITVGSDTLHSSFPCVFIVKYDPNATVLWYKTCRAMSNSIRIGGVATNNAGEVFLTGTYLGNGLLAENDTLPATVSGEDIFVLKYDMSGNLVQSISVPDPGNESVTGIDVSANGDIVICGQFKGNFIFANDTVMTASASYSDLFVAGFSPGLIPQWMGSCAGNYNEELSDIQVDASGNIYVTGLTKSTTLIAGNDTLSAALSSENILVVKFSSTGIVQWARSYGTTTSDHDYGRGLELDVNGYPTVMGRVTAGTVFGNYTTPAAGTFIAKFDPTGNLVWATSVSTSGWACGADLLDNFYIAGTINNSAMFGTIPVIPQGQYDVFIAKMSLQTGVEEHAVSAATFVFPNPSTGLISLSGLDPKEACRVVVYNVLGEAVHAVSLQAGTNSLDLSGLPRGLYVVKVDGAKARACKVVLE
jgi:hypothetical protein